MGKPARAALKLFVGQTPAVPSTRVSSIAELDEFECVGWRATVNCSSDSERNNQLDAGCSYAIKETDSGYCEFRHRKTHALQYFMLSSCNSPASKLGLTCANATSFMRYNLLADEYEPSKPLSVAQCQQDFIRENSDPEGDGVITGLTSNSDIEFDRGIAIVVYEKQLLSVYAQVRSLRAMGCVLPIELWYVPSEIDPRGNKLLEDLQSDYGAYLRVVDDPTARHYFSKVYAVAYSAFDNVLFMDADNFAVRDPTYLFDTPEFTATGALFWPDYWRPNHTTFDVNEKSFVWELLGVDYVDMAEQESGQILVDRTRHMVALRALLHYALSTPNLIQDLKLLWGDKDLFRMAWMRTRSSFHMIQRPPGSAGPTATETHETADGHAETTVVFCGVTMAQHDPRGQIVFLHRNVKKMVHGEIVPVWTHIVQYREGLNIEHYDIELVVNHAQFPHVNACWGRYHDFEPRYSLRPISDFPFAGIEQQLMRFAAEAARKVHA